MTVNVGTRFYVGEEQSCMQSFIPQKVLALRGSGGVAKEGAMVCPWLRSRHAFALKH